MASSLPQNRITDYDSWEILIQSEPGKSGRHTTFLSLSISGLSFSNGLALLGYYFNVRD